MESPILGFRVWRTDEKKLFPITAVGTGAWIPGVNKSICAPNMPKDAIEGNEGPPHVGHHCGFNAWYSIEDVGKIDPAGLGIIGAIVGAGKMELHPTGFRSSEAQVIAVLDNRLNLQGVSEYYGVPVFHSKEELLDYAKTKALYIPEAPAPDLARESNEWMNMLWPLDSVDDRPSIESDGDQIWFKNRLIHRDYDRPAWISKGRRSEQWYQNGRIHRDNDRPARVFHTVDGDVIMEQWYQNGLIHREGDRPALQTPSSRRWLLNGKLHRTFGPAVIREDGYEEYWKNGELWHPEGQATIRMTSGTQIWAQTNPERLDDFTTSSLSDISRNRIIHRLDGPAVIFPDGREEYWVDGIKLGTDPSALNGIPKTPFQATLKITHK